MEETENNSAPPTQARDSSGILRTKISLGRKPSIIMPFYLMKNELPSNPITGSMNLLSYYGLDHAWNKFCNNKKLKEELSAFMPNLPGNIDAAGSLRQLIEKPPICGKEILPLGSAETVGFRLLPGSVSDFLSCIQRLFVAFQIPEEYRTWSVGPSNAADKKKRKRKHENILGDEGPEEDAEKRAKRLKKEEERREKKKKKKDKKRKVHCKLCVLKAIGYLHLFTFFKFSFHWCFLENDGDGKPRFFSANDSGCRLFEFLTTTIVLGSTKRLS
ncbi:Med19 domain containing protein [Trichuris trichiura]|uniref:Mediator of RNA polymerase II transcription subunit 19 n=1 Tax=Trichuris trichiura TaxID=36087 RepID=A0A077ZIU0_TRITR|nr:Med19 domain containing protein [Trichuris trichiura]